MSGGNTRLEVGAAESVCLDLDIVLAGPKAIETEGTGSIGLDLEQDALLESEQNLSTRNSRARGIQNYARQRSRSGLTAGGSCGRLVALRPQKARRREAGQQQQS